MTERDRERRTKDTNEGKVRKRERKINRTIASVKKRERYRKTGEK
jgi:hypothetical protein